MTSLLRSCLDSFDNRNSPLLSLASNPVDAVMIKVGKSELDGKILFKPQSNNITTNSNRANHNKNIS